MREETSTDVTDSPIELIRIPSGSTDDRGNQESDQPPENAVSEEDRPPNGGYGWVCTACVFMINAHTWGLNSVSKSTSSICFSE